jgi:hypothetical protein
MDSVKYTHTQLAFIIKTRVTAKIFLIEKKLFKICKIINNTYYM